MMGNLFTLLLTGIRLIKGRLVRPHPPVTRAIVEAEKILRAAGIKTVRWEPHNHAESWEILVRTASL